MSAPTIDDWVQRIWALQSFGRTDDAIAEARQALAEHPGEAELLGSLAWLEFFHGDRARSRELAEQTLAARPGDWRGLNILLENAVASGDVAEGERLGWEAVAAYPDGPDAHLALAYALAADRKQSRAEAKQRRSEISQQVAEAVELAPERVETLRRGSILLARAGDERASAQMLSRALALDPDNEELLMLVGTSPDATEVQGLRVLSGVLTANPQQRQAARELNSIVWTRTVWLAAISLLPLAGMMLFGYLLFGDDGLETTQRQRRQVVGIFGVIGFGWVVLYVYLRRALPKGYLRRLFGEVWWVRVGLVLAAVATLATMFLALAFAVRGLPTQQRMSGSYIGGLTAMIGFVAWLVLIAELLVCFARSVSERRTGLFPGDAEGLEAAKAHRRGALISLAIRGCAAVLFALVPVVAAGIATRPEAANGFPAVAVAIAVPPLIWAVLAAADVWRIRAQIAHASQSGPRTMFWLTVAVSVVAVVGTWFIADWHAAQNDPPPTPYELEMQERTAQLRQSQDDLQETIDELNELSDQLGQ